jgi:hypothetical protein
MKANLGDMNNVLFEQLERLNDDDLTGEELENQLKKSKAIGGIAAIIVQNSTLILKAAKYAEDSGNAMPRALIGEKK